MHHLLALAMATTVISSSGFAQGTADSPSSERPRTYTFDAAAGDVPTGWERGYAPNGDLRMRPAGQKSAWLDLALDKVPPDSTKPPLIASKFVENLRSGVPSNALSKKIEVESPDRAYVEFDYPKEEQGATLMNRSWYLLLGGGQDTLYVLTATASEYRPSGHHDFDSRFIADAERAVLSLVIRR
jgi:hypothetical protein